MCILSDNDIQARLADGTLGIEPFEPRHLTPNGYDLTIKEVQVRGAAAATTQGAAVLPAGGGFLISTGEYVRMPPDVSGQLWIRSSYARRGIMAAFGKVEAGFEGELTIGAFNAAPEPVELLIGDRFCQIIFEKMHSPPAVSYEERSGTYQGQRGITPARAGRGR